MTRVESNTAGGEKRTGKNYGSLRNLPLDRIMVEVPINSPEYQAFLEANRLREQAREEFGGPDPNAEKIYQEAVRKVSELARSFLGTERRLL